MKERKLFKGILLLMAIILGSSSLSACSAEFVSNHARCVAKLDGRWKFTIGDNLDFARTDFDDSSWDKISVPASWESQGYYGYDGYAWYRKSFDVPADMIDDNLYIYFGNIDDVDQVYLNGKLVGASGQFPNDYETAYGFARRYSLPKALLKADGKNVIAIRVYDDGGDGGIVWGSVGVYTCAAPEFVDTDLSGSWKISFSDDMGYKETNYDDTQWKTLLVPGNWESQGYWDYDGFAWYRKEFEVKPEQKGTKLVLMLGQIDDYDQVYINGKLIGSTGLRSTKPNYAYKIDRNWRNNDSPYQEYRAYSIPEELINFGGNNVIAVRVFDIGGFGGIYSGPVGITTPENVKSFIKEHESRINTIFEIHDFHMHWCDPCD